MKRREFVTKLIIGAGGAALSTSPAPVSAQERRYLSEEQALRLVFPHSRRIVKDEKDLNVDQLRSVENHLGMRLRNSSQIVYRGETGGVTDGFAMIANEIGKEQSITFIVGITNNFKVQRVALMVFRESRGWEVEDARFTNQFRGKASRDRLAVGVDIIGITGATLSSRAFCRGAKRALAICETLYKR